MFFRRRQAFDLCAAAARRDENAKIYVHLRKDVNGVVVALL